LCQGCCNASDIFSFGEDMYRQDFRQLEKDHWNEEFVRADVNKLSINRGLEMDMDTALLMEKLAQAILFGSEDKNEGTQAFIEKRSPQFKGR
jgi:enoyl-CoA hydratase/carnithine racemase